MKHINKVHISRETLDETIKSLQDYGKHGCEGLVLWLGSIQSDDTCRVEKVLTPPQESINSEDGVGYFVTSETLFTLNKFLSSTGLRLLAQVHSHPGRAYHSTADDRYCIVTLEGGFSIVVPDFGFGTCDFNKWATYRLINGAWKQLSVKTLRTLFIIEGEPEEQSPEDNNLLAAIKRLFR
jgi:hypothetical protein